MNIGPISDLSEIYLSEVSPKDKPWDVHRFEATLIQRIYAGSDFDRYAQRMAECSGLLGFGLVSDADTQELFLKLVTARFCRVRLCPVCQWRRSLMWIARFLGALPSITRDFPKARYLFLTLTVKNCKPEELRQTIQEMNHAWRLLTKRKQWPGLGFARATEVTKGHDGSCHPHFHVLMMVSESYFQGAYYLSQARWSELWQGCLGVDYLPVLDIRTVKPNPKRLQANLEPDQPDSVVSSQLQSAIIETFKYGIKPQDAIGQSTDRDRAWFLELTKQLHKMRAINLGGVFRTYLSESEPENLISETEEPENEEICRLHFGWREMIKRYTRVTLD